MDLLHLTKPNKPNAAVSPTPPPPQQTVAKIMKALPNIPVDTRAVVYFQCEISFRQCYDLFSNVTVTK